MAGGSFNPDSLPTAPGFYVNFESVANAVITGGTNGTVLVPFTADWGPENTFVSVTSLAQYDATYSSSTGGTGRAAVAGALLGMGSRPGAAQVLGYRAVSASGVAATKVLQDSGASTIFVTLTAKYKGVRANNWSVTVQANPVDNTKKDLILLENSVEVERHTLLSATSPAGWVNQIKSRFFTVTAGAAVDVANVSGSAFNTVAGNSGTNLLEADWVAFQSAAESQTFNILAPADLTDSTIRSALVTWAASRNNNGQRFMLVIGGAAGESVATATSRSTAANNENVVNIGYTDLLDVDGNTISTARFAPRLAGIIADAGVTRSITQQRVSDVTLKVVPTAADLEQAYAAGMVMLVSDSVSPRIHQDMTTYATATIVAGVTKKPRAEFGKIKAVRIHQQIENDLTMAANNGWLGGDSANTPVIQTVILSGVSGYLRILEDTGVVNTGWTVSLDPNQDNTGNALHLVYGISTVKSIEQIFNTIVLS